MAQPSPAPVIDAKRAPRPPRRRAGALIRRHGMGKGLRVDDRLEPRQPYGCLHIRIEFGLDRVILQMQQAETIAFAVVGAPVIEGEELEIGHADRLFTHKAEAISIASPSDIVRGFPPG